MSLVANYSDSDENENSDGDSSDHQDQKKTNENTDEKSTSVSQSAECPVVTKTKQLSPKLSLHSKIISQNFNSLLRAASSLSSDSESDDDGEPFEDTNIIRRQNSSIKLDNPFRTFGDVNVAKEDSVFRNPFREKEDERIAILERHVKMTENPGTAVTINGKKICWNYRKRKCYLGTQCPYAHDSDVPLTDEQLKEQKLENDLQRSAAGTNVTPVNSFNSSNAKSHLPGTASVVAGGYDSTAFFSSPHLGGKGKNDEADDGEEPLSPFKTVKSKKRVGLTNNVIPSKRALNLYNKTKDK